jgi:hypothetical protein
VEWVDDDHLLVNAADLIDIPKGIVLWHYDLPMQSLTSGSMIGNYLGFGWAQNEGGRGGMRAGMFFLALPHPEAQQAASALTQDKLLVLQPGVQVALDLRVPVDNPQDLEALTTSYTQQLKAMGISVAAGAPLAFQASVEAGDTHTMTYRAIGRLGSETVSATTQKCRLALAEGGKVLWERKADVGGTPMFVSHAQGETLQAAIDRENKRALLNFFRDLSLPGRLAREAENGAYGFCTVTPMGTVAYVPGK